MPPKKTKHISPVVAAEVVKQDSKAARKANTYVLDVVRGDDEDGDDSEELDDMLTESSEDEDEDVKPKKKKSKATKRKAKKATKRLKKAPNGVELMEHNYQYFERAMEARINNQARLQNEKLDDFQEAHKLQNKTLLKAIHHMSSSLTHFINRSANNTTIAFKNEAKVTKPKSQCFIDISSSQELPRLSAYFITGSSEGTVIFCPIFIGALS